jgi:Spy/CpxP family protein refolding chaperone
MTKIKSFFFCAIVLTSASAIAQSRAPMPCPPGATCRSNSATGNGENTTSYGAASATEPGASDPEQQKIWNAARQLKLDADQRAQLDSSLKAQKDESADADKALKDARAALAQALQNGETSLESEIENLSSANAKVQESELRRWASLYAVLTPDQQRRLLMMPTPLSQASASTGAIQTQ